MAVRGFPDGVCGAAQRLLRLGRPPAMEGGECSDRILNALENKVHDEAAADMGSAGDLYTGTIGPGMALFVPPGWLVSEKTGMAAAYGVKKVILPTTAQDIGISKEWDKVAQSKGVVDSILNLGRKLGHIVEGGGSGTG